MNVPVGCLTVSVFERLLQELEEPGEEETSRYDMIVPTIVRPKGSRSSNKELFDEEFKVRTDRVADDLIERLKI